MNPLFTSRIKGNWKNIQEVAEYTPSGWKKNQGITVPVCDAENLKPLPDTDSVELSAYKKAWARLISKAYEIAPFVCSQYGSEMKCQDCSSLRNCTPLDVIAIILKPQEIKCIIHHLVKQGRPPPGIDMDDLN